MTAIRDSRATCLEALSTFALAAPAAVSEVDIFVAAVDLLTLFGRLTGAIGIIHPEGGELVVMLTRAPSGELDASEPNDPVLEAAIAATALPVDHHLLAEAPSLARWFDVTYAGGDGACWVGFTLAGGAGAHPDFFLFRFGEPPDAAHLDLVGNHLTAAITVARVRSDLERRVAQRTDELSERVAQLARTQASLVEASRRAGMADVATSVLHNVGNVLNSVNVSAERAAAVAGSSKVFGLDKAVALWRVQPDPGKFISDDPRGVRLVEYFGELAKVLGKERAAIQHELTSLVRNIDHIKVIVAMQQSSARPTNMFERVSLAEVIGHAVMTNEASFERHRVRLDRELFTPIEIDTDRHKVFQILINLLSNASQAVKSGISQPRIVVRTRTLDPDRVELEVEDNGVGIAPEHLEQIFVHGFTTKPDGHGFGLHSSACAAIELGGRLSARSDGVQRGAVFTLNLPMRAPKASAGRADASGAEHRESEHRCECDRKPGDRHR